MRLIKLIIQSKLFILSQVALFIGELALKKDCHFIFYAEDIPKALQEQHPFMEKEE